MPNYVRFRGNQNDNQPNIDIGPSPFIWADCPVVQMNNDPNVGFHLYDNFVDLGLTPTLTTQIAYGKYKAYAVSGGTIAGVSSIGSTERMAGGISLSPGSTAGNGAGISQAYPAAYLSGSTSTSGKLWFEASVAVSSIAANSHNFLLGIGETDQWTLGSGVPLTGTGDGITNSASFVGFLKTTAGAGVVNTAYSDRATSLTSVLAAATTFSAANTNVKLGMVYDPNLTTNCISFYVNGIDTGTYISSTTLAATTNLKANAVGLICSMCAGSSASTPTTGVRWWRLAQLYA
jgi:hypothetical protein